MIEALIQLGLPLLLLAAAFFSGRRVERRHYASIRARERELATLPAVTFRRSRASGQSTHGPRVGQRGGVGRLLQALPGRAAYARGRAGPSYESLLDRARREAILRCKEQARERGFQAIVNLRLETTRISRASRNRNATPASRCSRSAPAWSCAEISIASAAQRAEGERSPLGGVRSEPPRRRHQHERGPPLREFALLVAGLVGVLLALLALAALAIDRLVPLVPSALEVRWFGGWLADEAGTDPRDAAVQALLDRLVSHWSDAPYPFYVHVIDEPDPNAIALPGGAILVTGGLLERVKSENEPALVLGHELGHFRARDHLRGLRPGLAAQLVLGAIGTSGELVSGISTITGELAQRSFVRRQERDADAFGLGLVHAEYGHVAGAADFFARLSDRSTASALRTRASRVTSTPTRCTRTASPRWRPRRPRRAGRAKAARRPGQRLRSRSERAQSLLHVALARALPRAVGREPEHARLRIEIDREDRVDARLERGVLDRHQRLDAAVEVARHQVGGADSTAARGAAPEAEDARVLEVAAQDRAHADPLGQPRHAGPQAADAAHDQVDLGARLRRLVERVDQRRDRRGCSPCAIRPSGSRLARDPLDQPAAQAVGRHEQLPVAARAAAAGQVVEQLRDVARRASRS